MSCDNTEHLHTLVKSVTFLDFVNFKLKTLNIAFSQYPSNMEKILFYHIICILQDINKLDV